MSTPRSHLLDIYDCWLHLALDRRQLASLRRKHGNTKIPNLDRGSFGMLIQFRDSPADRPDVNHYVIYLDVAQHRGNTSQLIDTIAHEATHLAAGILDSTNASYDGDSEPLAWMVGWLTRWVWDGLE